MPICSTCGGPDHLRCNCVVTPYCDQCDENDACNSEMDTACVIYHPTYPGQTPLPTELITLGLPNGSSAQTIFEAIDEYLGHTNSPLTPINTPSIHIITTLHTIQADTQISPDTNNQLSIHSNGLYAAPYNDLFQVKIDAASIPKYLIDSLIGGTDGCVNIDIISGGGLLQIQPSLDIECLADRICSADPTIREQIATCLLTSGLTILDTPSIDLTLATVGPQLQLSANVKVSATAGNEIIINSDGLYAPTSTPTPPLIINNNADNRLLTANGTTTSIDAEATILYDAGTLTAPNFNYTFQVIASQEFDRAVFTSNLILNQANYGTKASNITGSHGQLFINTQVNTTFGRGHFLGADIGELVLNSVGGTTSTGFIAAVIPKVAVFNSDNYTDIASIRTNYPGTDAILGGLYSGTITNYYGVFIGDTNGDEGGISHARVTNSYAIFQEGSTLLNSFATAVVVTSDERVKTNIEDYTKGLDEIEQINIVKYNFRESPDSDKKVGVLAQAIEQVIPEAIQTSPNSYYNIDDFKKLDNDVLVYTLINAIKELSAKVKVLETKS